MGPPQVSGPPAGFAPDTHRLSTRWSAGCPPVTPRLVHKPARAGVRSALVCGPGRYDSNRCSVAAKGGQVAVTDDLGTVRPPPQPDFDRQPPHDRPAEHSVLGGMLLSQ